MIGLKILIVISIIMVSILLSVLVGGFVYSSKNKDYSLFFFLLGVLLLLIFTVLGSVLYYYGI